MTSFKQTLIQTRNSAALPLVLLGALWTIQIINASIFHYSLNYWGVFPRTFHGLWGLIFAPWLHFSYQHMIGNSFMLFLLSWIICFNDKKIWFMSLFFGAVIGGAITWVLGGQGSHAGSSIWIFTLWGTIIGVAIFEKKPFYIIASLVLMASYGVSILYGLVPQNGVSWAGHFGGLIAGLLCAKYLKNHQNR